MSWGGSSFRYGARQRKPYVPGFRREADLLAFIVAYQREHDGVSPSFPEMMASVGFSSKSGVHRAMAALIAGHKIRTLPHRARAIEVVPQEVPGDPRPQFEDCQVRPLVAPGPEAQFFVIAPKNCGEDARLVELGRDDSG